MASTAQQQKFIRIADQSEHHWQTVTAYKGSNLAADEEDAKCLEKAEKTAEQQAAKKRRKAVAGRVTTKQSPDSGQASIQQPQKPLFPRPQLTRSHFTPRIPDSCFNCEGDLSTGSSLWFPIHSDHLEHKLVFTQSSVRDLSFVSSAKSLKSSDLLQHKPVIASVIALPICFEANY